MTRAALVALSSLLLAPTAGAGLAPSATSTQSVRPPTVTVLERLAPERFFEGAGVIVGVASAFRASERAELLAQNRFRWVAVKVHHGLGLDQANLDELSVGWAHGFRRRGIQVCGWGVGDVEPEQEAQLAAELIRQHELDCYIADVEAAYMGEGYGGDPARSGRFVSAFRRELPELTAAFTTMGGAWEPWVYPFDYGPWAAGGFALLPQAYLSISEGYCPRCTVEHARRAGFPVSRVHPMIGVGWEQGQPAKSGADYTRPLTEAGARGFSVFLGETTSDDDFRALGTAISEGKIAH